MNLQLLFVTYAGFELARCASVYSEASGGRDADIFDKSKRDLRQKRANA